MPELRFNCWCNEGRRKADNQPTSVKRALRLNNFPKLLAMAVHGRFYLIDVKGSVNEMPISLSTTKYLSAESDALNGDVRKILNPNALNHYFKKIKILAWNSLPDQFLPTTHS